MNILEDVNNAKYLILDNLGKAIKVIQHHASTEPGLTLSNESCMLQSLAHSLDLNLRHGLRNPHVGYWPLVKLLTHSATQKIINSLLAVHTPLGKGRAWLYMTLSEGSLESYLGCLSADKQELSKHYAPHALMRDAATRDRLVRLVAAVQHVQFDLDADVSYLETSTYKHQTLQMTSSVTSSLASPVDSGVASVDSDVDASSATLSLRDDDSAIREMDDHARETEQTHTDPSIEAMEDTPPNSFIMKDPVNIHEDNKLLESKRDSEKAPSHNAARSTMESFNKLNSGETLVGLEVCKSLTASDIANQNVEPNQNCISDNSLAKNNTDCEEIVFRRQRKKRNKHEAKVKRVSFHEDLITNPQENHETSSTFSASFLPANAVLKRDAVKGRYTWCGEGDTPYMCGNKTEENTPANTQPNNYKSLRSDKCYRLNSTQASCFDGDDNEMLQMDALLPSGPNLKRCAIAEREGPEGQEDPQKTSSTLHLYSAVQAQSLLPSDSQKSISTLHSSTKIQPPSIAHFPDSNFKTSSTLHLYSSSVNLSKVPSMASSIDCLSDADSDIGSRYKRKTSSADSQSLGRRNMTMMDTKATLLNRFLRLVTAKKLIEKRARIVKLSRSLYIAGVKSSYELNEELNASVDAEIKTGRRDLLPSAGFEVEVSADVEGVLERLVFTSSDERLYKVYCVRSCYSVAGASTPLLVLLTDVNLYLTGATDNYDYCNHLVLPYEKLDSILVGPNCQSLLLLAKDGATQFLLATGDRDVTEDMVARIELAMRTNGRGIPPAVKCVDLGDLTTLKRSLVKQAAVLKADDLCHYSLVYVQDNHSSPPSTPLGPTKEGHLMYRTASQATPQPWAPGYFILKAGVVYLFEDKDHRMPKSVIMLSNGQCKGCRRLQDRRPHTFEVALGWARSIQLAASDEYQASDWLQAFIQAAAGVYQCTSVETMACSLVLTSHRIVTCLEQFPSGNARALSTANVTDLTAFRAEHSWCVLEFACREVHENSGSGDWILYFTSVNEMRSFEASLRLLWGRLKTVEFPSSDIVEPNLVTRCLETGQLLHQAWDHLL